MYTKIHYFAISLKNSGGRGSHNLNNLPYIDINYCGLLQTKTVTFCETDVMQILTFELSYIYLSIIIWGNKLVILRVSKVF